MQRALRGRSRGGVGFQGVGRHIQLFGQVALSDGLHLESKFSGRLSAQLSDAVRLRETAFRAARSHLLASEALTR